MVLLIPSFDASPGPGATAALLEIPFLPLTFLCMGLARTTADPLPPTADPFAGTALPTLRPASTQAPLTVRDEQLLRTTGDPTLSTETSCDCACCATLRGGDHVRTPAGGLPPHFRQGDLRSRVGVWIPLPPREPTPKFTADTFLVGDPTSALTRLSILLNKEFWLGLHSSGLAFDTFTFPLTQVRSKEPELSLARELTPVRDHCPVDNAGLVVTSSR